MIRARAQAEASPVDAAVPEHGSYRWRICALLFFATTINYVDRQVLGVLAPYLQPIIGWNEIQYGYIVGSFQAAYAVGLLAVGGIIDRLGARLGYAIAIAIWSLAAMSHALVRSVIGFAIARFALGLGESANFPAAVKTVAEWFPRKERALVTGIFNSGSNVGAIVAPLAVPWIAVRLGWQWAFLFTGFFSAAWLIAWLMIYRSPREHRSLGKTEFAYIQADGEEPVSRIAWTPLLVYRQTWAFLLGKFITDPVWWFLSFWLPKFLNSEYGLSLTNLGPPLIAIYLMADGGSILGGWLAGAFLRNGWTANRARKSAMLVCASLVVPVAFAARARHLWAAVALVGLAAAAHQGWSANLYTLVSDTFPRRAVASVVGIGGFGGAVSGMLVSTFTGFLLQSTGSYLPLFVMASAAYLIALLAIHLLVPRLEPAEFR